MHMINAPTACPHHTSYVVLFSRKAKMYQPKLYLQLQSSAYHLGDETGSENMPTVLVQVPEDAFC